MNTALYPRKESTCKKVDSVGTTGIFHLIILTIGSVFTRVELFRKYRTPYSYELHMRQIHSDGAEGKLVCEYCCKDFIGKITFNFV
jgi:hypothetical protein